MAADDVTDTVLLFTSAPPDRPQYTLDFLTCLASPNGHRVTFSYKREWLTDEVYGTALIGRRALVIFCEPDDVAGDMQFLPFRWADIISFGPEEIVKRQLAEPDTRLAMTFKLDRFVYASPQTIEELTMQATTALRRLAVRPFRRGEGETTQNGSSSTTTPRLAARSCPRRLGWRTPSNWPAATRSRTRCSSRSLARNT